MARKSVKFSFIAPQKTNVRSPICAYPDCTQQGMHRAPKNRYDIRDYIYLCLEHVKEYNANWNYYKGQSEKVMTAEMNADATWRRPSRPFSDSAENHKAYTSSVKGNPFHIFGPGTRMQEIILPENVKKSLSFFSLSWPIDDVLLKNRYKILVKKYHPDVNPGNAAAEEKFKQLSIAYKVLLAYYPKK